MNALPGTSAGVALYRAGATASWSDPVGRSLSTLNRRRQSGHFCERLARSMSMSSTNRKRACRCGEWAETTFRIVGRRLRPARAAGSAHLFPIDGGGSAAAPPTGARFRRKGRVHDFRVPFDGLDLFRLRDGRLLAEGSQATRPRRRQTARAGKFTSSKRLRDVDRLRGERGRRSRPWRSRRGGPLLGGLALAQTAAGRRATPRAAMLVFEYDRNAFVPPRVDPSALNFPKQIPSPNHETPPPSPSAKDLTARLALAVTIAATRCFVETRRRSKRTTPQVKATAPGRQRRA